MASGRMFARGIALGSAGVTASVVLLALQSADAAGAEAQRATGKRSAPVSDRAADRPDASATGDDGLRLYPEAPDFTLPPGMAGLVAPRTGGARAAARTAGGAAGDARPHAAAAASAPRLLPTVTGGIPVVVRRSTPFRAAAFTEDRPTAVPPAAERHRLPSPEVPRRLDADVTATTAATAEGEIRSMLRDYLAAFNRHDAGALAACWSGGCESVDVVSGDVTKGRGAVEEVFTALFQADDAASIDLDVESVRMVRHDVAVVDAVSRIAFSGSGAAARSRLTAVVTRENGAWMLSDVRESPLPAESAAPATRDLDALDWLVGDWEDAGDGVSARTRCFWSTGHAFLIRCHTAAFDGADRPPRGDDSIPDLLPPGSGGPREVTEVIGWDPSTASIRSWVFTSDGRFAEGTWTRHGDRWLVRMEGRGADAGAACTATLERIGTEKLAYRCTGDALADALPPACDFSRAGGEEASAPLLR